MKVRIAKSSESNQFILFNSVKQNCVLAPTLFGFHFSMMLLFAFRIKYLGIQVMNGFLSNMRGLKANKKVTLSIVRDLEYLDNHTLRFVFEITRYGFIRSLRYFFQNGMTETKDLKAFYKLI